MWIKNVSCVDCSSSDALSLYRNDGVVTGYCNSSKCEDGVKFKSNRKLRKSYLNNEMDLGKEKSKGTERMQKEEKVLKSPISNDMIKKILEKTSAKGNDFRSIPDDILKYYLVRTEYDEEGAVLYRYYPVMEGTTPKGKPKIVGFKQRVVKPKKTFRAKGRVDKDTNDLFGEWKCKGHGKYILLTSGEEDVMAAKAMIRQQKNEDAADIDVVCSTISETGQIKQIQRKYEFFDGYDNIIIAMDMDEAGENATEKLLDVLPTYKTKVMYQPANDANQCLREGLGKQWLISFYQAFKPKIAGITGSSNILNDIIEVSSQEKIALPPFLRKANDMLKGGLTKNTFNILAAHTSVGKSTFTNQMLYHLVMNCRDKVGIMSLEASKGVLGEQLLSLHLGKRISFIEDSEERIEFINENKEKAKEFFVDEEGNDRFYIMDDRTYLSTPSEVFKQIQKMVRGLGVKLLIIDVLSDLMDNLDINQQAEFMGNIKKIVAANDVCILGIMHMRKDSSGKENNPHLVNEQNIYGSSTAIKSASTVLLLSRDKLAEDMEERNTTRVTLTKNRGSGTTGSCGEIYYDTETHTLHDKEDWIESQIGEL